MPSPDSPSTDLARHLRAFAREHPSDSLYARLAELIAERPAVLDLLLAAPPARRWANLLFAAIHDRLLELKDTGAALPQLAAYYPSLGGPRPPDDALGEALDSFADVHATSLRKTLASRITQTNEVGRSAVLWPALAEIARTHDGHPLALFDFGCSAGLNLGVDALRVTYRHADGSPWFEVGAKDAQALVLPCRLLGGPPPTTPWRIERRLGVDRAPVDLDDTGALRWLRACLWPGETARAERFERALALARASGHEVRAASDGLAVLAEWLRELPAGVTPVLFNSWVLAYFPPDELAAHTARVHDMIAEHGLVWLSAEDNQRLAATTSLPPQPTRHPDASSTATYWAMTARDGDGVVASRLLASSHPHGEWLDWCCTPAQAGPR
jgi:hypothetical protein